jgi:hypothetical protein
MTQYLITETNIITYEQVPTGTDTFSTYQEFVKRGRDWKGSTMVALYNNLAASHGLRPVHKFTNRETGIKRLWQLVQNLPVTTLPPPVPEKSVSKKETVLAMVQAPCGASLEELMSATGWQAHSVRGFLSTQRRDYTIARTHRPDNVSAYYATKKPDQ